MSTHTQTMFDHSSMLKRLYVKPIENHTIIEEEETGYGPSLLNNHVTEILDDNVRQRVVQMSVLEIIS